MKRFYWDREARDWVEKRPVAAPSVAVIHDTIDGLLNHADGRRYDSKRAFSRATKAAGMIEIGNDTAALHRGAIEAQAEHAMARRNDIAASVQRAEAMLNQGYRPQPLDRVRGPDDIRGDAW